MSARLCPQCSSKWCGPVVCRFTAIAHKHARELQQWNNATAQIDKRPKWERDAATGARDSYAPSGYWK